MTDSAGGLAIEDIEIKGESNQLSDEFQKLEYIETTDNKPYLDFGIPFSNNTRIQYKFLQAVNNGNRTIGTGSTTNNSNEMRFFMTGGNIYLDIKTSAHRTNVTAENLLNAVHEFEIGNCYVKNLKTDEYVTQRTSQPETMFTKTNSNIKTGDANGVVKSYYVKIYDGETLMRDCIPCYRKADGEVGMYDLVNGVFYTNQGTGSFIKSNDVGNSFVSPSAQYPSKIECVLGTNVISVNSKNLIGFKKDNWIGGYFNSDGTIVNYGTTESTLIDSKYYVLPANSNEFVLSFMPLKNFKLKRDGIAFYDKDKNPLSGVSFGLNDNSVFYKGTRAIIKKKFNVPEGAKYFRFNLRWLQLHNNTIINMNEEFYNYISEFQLETGIEATEYVKYEGDDYALSLGDLELLKGEYIHKIGENWYKNKVYEKIAGYNNEEITTEYISTTGGLDEGATVYYKLENEIDEEITDEVLIAQLEALSKAKTGKRITYIDSVANSAKPILRLTYKKDLETIRENDRKEFQDEINNLKEAIVAIGGV